MMRLFGSISRRGNGNNWNSREKPGPTKASFARSKPARAGPQASVRAVATATTMKTEATALKAAVAVNTQRPTNASYGPVPPWPTPSPKPKNKVGPCASAALVVPPKREVGAAGGNYGYVHMVVFYRGHPPHTSDIGWLARWCSTAPMLQPLVRCAAGWSLFVVAVCGGVVAVRTLHNLQAQAIGQAGGQGPRGGG